MPSRRYFLSFLALWVSVSGCAGSHGSLNSDRIERRFGSYGVEVLTQTDNRRTSSLYSIEGARRVTRTYAIVEFNGKPRPEIAAEHALVLAGGSIGATFRKAGWSIRKQHLFIGALEVPPAYAALAGMMQIELPATLAVHQYLFIVSRDERSFTYATITEVHHPDYLGPQDLADTYGEILFDDSNRDSIHDFIGPPAVK